MKKLLFLLLATSVLGQNYPPTAPVLTNGQTGVTLTGSFSGSGSFSNLIGADYQGLLYPGPFAMTGPSSYCVFGIAWGSETASDLNSSPGWGTNSEKWWLNTVSNYSGLVATNIPIQVPMGCKWLWLDDGTFQGITNGQLAWDSICFPKGIPYDVAFSHTNGVKVMFYTSFATNTCGGYPIGGLGNLYNVIMNMLQLGADGVKIDDCVTTPAVQTNANYYKACMQEVGRAIHDFNATNTSNPRQFAVVPVAFGNIAVGNPVQVIPEQLLGGRALEFGAPPGNGNVVEDAESAQWSITNMWLSILSSQNADYDFYQNWPSESWFRIGLYALTHEIPNYDLGNDRDPYYTNSGYVGNVKGQSNSLVNLENPAFVAIWDGNRNMPSYLSYTNTNTFIFWEPIGSVNSSNAAVLVANATSGNASITVYATNFNGAATASYVATQVFPMAATVSGWSLPTSYTFTGSFTVSPLPAGSDILYSIAPAATNQFIYHQTAGAYGSAFNGIDTSTTASAWGFGSQNSQVPALWLQTQGNASANSYTLATYDSTYTFLNGTAFVQLNINGAGEFRLQTDGALSWNNSGNYSDNGVGSIAAASVYASTNIVATNGFASHATNYGNTCYNSTAVGITNKLTVNIQLDLKVASGTVAIFNNAGTCVSTNTTFVSATGEIEPVIQPGGYVTNTSGTVTIEGAWGF